MKTYKHSNRKEYKIVKIRHNSPYTVCAKCDLRESDCLNQILNNCTDTIGSGTYLKELTKPILTTKSLKIKKLNKLIEELEQRVTALEQQTKEK